MSNFTQMAVLLTIGIATIAVSAFLPERSAETATVLKMLGSGIAMSSLAILSPQSARILLQGERATDKADKTAAAAAKEGSTGG